MKTTLAATIMFCSLASCSRVPKSADAAITPAAAPTLAFYDNARVFREADAAKTATALLQATWNPKLEAAQKAVSDAKTAGGKGKDAKVESAGAVLAKVQQDAQHAVQESDAKLIAARDAAVAKLAESRGLVILPVSPVAGAKDVSADVVAFMNASTPEAVAREKAKDDEIAALRKQLAERPPLTPTRKP